MRKYVKCPRCNRPMLRVLYQGHNLAFNAYLICVNATQLRCLRCNLTLESATGGIDIAAKQKDYGKYNLYTTSYRCVDILNTREQRANGTDYLFKGDLA